MTLPNELPPLPASGVDFTIDDQFRGASHGQDRVIDALHKSGWTMHRVFTEPNTMLPLPEVKFPAGRVYLFADDVAVVVHQATGRVIASLPAHAALRTLDEHTPEVIAGDEWARTRWDEIKDIDDEFEAHRRWQRQNFFSADGARWTVERTEDGRARITRNGYPMHEVDSGETAEKIGLHIVVVELVDYVLGQGH